jgi:8-amino-7-oxononanoate synthase
VTDSSSDETRPSKLSLGGKGNFIDQMRKANENVGRNRTTRLNAQPQQPARPPVGFDALPEYQRVMVQRKASEIIGVDNPFYRSHDEAAGATTTMDGEVYANFASYDYLGTNTDPRVTEAAKAAIDRFGISASASRLVAGERPVHAELEEKLASVYGVDAAVCFVSGYLTNVAAISCVVGPKDLVIHDEFIHNSALAGIKLSGATRRLFKHNDVDNLETVLNTLAGDFRRVLVIVEGVYSMDGDIADLPRLIELRNRYGFWLMVDEAHSLGVLGKTGRGSSISGWAPCRRRHRAAADILPVAGRWLTSSRQKRAVSSTASGLRLFWQRLQPRPSIFCARNRIGPSSCTGTVRCF